MAAKSADGKGGGTSGDGRMLLRLYVAGTGPNSAAARVNLRRILDGCKQPCSLEIVDCLDEPMRVIKEGVLVTPTLIRTNPLPRVTIIGSLTDADKVCDALGIPRQFKPKRPSAADGTKPVEVAAAT